MNSLSGTYLTRLPKDLEHLLVEKLKHPEITIEPSIYTRCPGLGIFRPFIYIRSTIVAKVRLGLPHMSLDGKVTLHSTVSETVKEILEFRENVLKDLPDSLELSTEIDLTTRPGYYFIECSEGAEAELGIDLLTKENMILLVDKILEYIASLTEKITPPTTSVNE